ncbi:MAG: GyrI-like domain-containing protein [Fibrobacteria bacterium]|nr:GyrI-like domain-containing protein [Fibrobacteria bacterium]
MSEEITVIKREETRALAISEKVGTMKLGKVMGPAYMLIMDLMKKAGVECGKDNIPFTVYKNIDWEQQNKTGLFAMINMMFFHKWDMDIGIPCPETVKAEGRAREIKLQAGEFVQTMHRGPYMKVGETYKKIQAYAMGKGIKLKNYSIEFYQNDPRETPATELKTEVLVPVK